LLTVDNGVLAVYITTTQGSVMTKRDSGSVMLPAAAGQQTRHTKWSVQMEINRNDKEENNKLRSESV